MAVRASREIVIEATPEAILDVLADVATMPSWSPVHTRAEVIDTSKLSGSVIKFGATVTLADEETDEEQTFRIVGEDEADIRNGRLSVTSPLARALIGKGEGDSVEVSTPRGNKSYEIVTMSFSPKPAAAARKRGKARAAR